MTTTKNRGAAGRRMLLAGLLAWAGVPAAAGSAAEVFQKVSPAVWQLLAIDAAGAARPLGSAVVVARHTLIAPCPPADAARLRVRLDTQVLDATLELRDADDALCQLRVPALAARALPLREAATLQPGQPAFAVGHAADGGVTIVAGMVSGLRRDAAGAVREVLASLVPTAGAGVFDGEGRLLGLALPQPRDGQNLYAVLTVERIRGLWRLHGRQELLRTDSPAETLATMDGRLQPGDELEYLVIDRFNDTKRQAIHRVDRIDGARVVMNGGGRVESLDGRLLSLDAPVAGDLDLMSPPGGWADAEGIRRGRWSVSFERTAPDAQLHYDLEGSVLGQFPMRTPAGTFDTVVVGYTGWARKVLTSQTVQLRVSVRLWYSTALRRPVRFESDVRQSASSLWAMHASREVTELVRVQRSAAAAPR